MARDSMAILAEERAWKRGKIHAALVREIEASGVNLETASDMLLWLSDYAGQDVLFKVLTRTQGYSDIISRIDEWREGGRYRGGQP